jgi:hypothetical protein
LGRITSIGVGVGSSVMGIRFPHAMDHHHHRLGRSAGGWIRMEATPPVGAAMVRRSAQRPMPRGISRRLTPSDEVLESLQALRQRIRVAKHVHFAVPKDVPVADAVCAAVDGVLASISFTSSTNTHRAHVVADNSQGTRRGHFRTKSSGHLGSSAHVPPSSRLTAGARGTVFPAQRWHDRICRDESVMVQREWPSAAVVELAAPTPSPL